MFVDRVFAEITQVLVVAQFVPSLREDSGTPIRAAVGGLLAGGSIFGGLTPGVAAGGGLLALYGTRQFQDYLMGRMGPQLQQQALEIARRMSGAPAGVVGGATAIQSGE